MFGIYVEKADDKTHFQAPTLAKCPSQKSARWLRVKISYASLSRQVVLPSWL